MRPVEAMRWLERRLIEFRLKLVLVEPLLSVESMVSWTISGSATYVQPLCMPIWTRYKEQISVYVNRQQRLCISRSKK